MSGEIQIYVQSRIYSSHHDEPADPGSSRLLPERQDQIGVSRVTAKMAYGESEGLAGRGRFKPTSLSYTSPGGTGITRAQEQPGNPLTDLIFLVITYRSERCVWDPGDSSLDLSLVEWTDGP